VREKKNVARRNCFASSKRHAITFFALVEPSSFLRAWRKISYSFERIHVPFWLRLGNAKKKRARERSLIPRLKWDSEIARFLFFLPLLPHRTTAKRFATTKCIPTAGFKRHVITPRAISSSIKNSLERGKGEKGKKELNGSVGGGARIRKDSAESGENLSWEENSSNSKTLKISNAECELS